MNIKYNEALKEIRAEARNKGLVFKKKKKTLNLMESICGA
jgi:hypothetical protein